MSDVLFSNREKQQFKCAINDSEMGEDKDKYPAKQ